MASSGFLKKSGLTPGKAVLIAFLSLVFVFVLVLQFGGNDAPTQQLARKTESEEDPETPRPTADVETNKHAEKIVPRREHKKWPPMEREKALQHDPFFTPQWSIVKSNGRPSKDLADQKERALASKRRAFEELSKKGVDAILLSTGGNVAIIGSKDVRVGDVLDGFRVAEINANGVVLEEHDPE